MPKNRLHIVFRITIFTDDWFNIAHFLVIVAKSGLTVRTEEKLKLFYRKNDYKLSPEHMEYRYHRLYSSP